MGRLDGHQRLVVATHNPGKLAEFAGLFRPFGLETVSAGDLGLPEPEETATTFEGNAELKAVTAARAAALPAIADDSGLAVDALGGDPGIYSARWAGPDKDFAAAMGKVHDALARVGAVAPGQRAARFVSVICLALPDGSATCHFGEVAGRIVWPPRGDGGFGYDPMFVPDGETRTFGEMTREEKAALSHRARAFEAFARAHLGR